MAIITGRFPVNNSVVIAGNTGNVGYWKKAGDKAEFTSFNNVVNGGEAEHLIGALGNQLYDFTNYSTSTKFPWTHIGPWAVKQKGDPSPQPPDKILYGTVLRVNNKPFRKRVRRGEIVVSDYSRVNAYLKYRNGGTKTVLEEPTLHFRYWQIVNRLGWSSPDWLTKFIKTPTRGSAPDDASSIAIGQQLGGGTSSVFGQYYQKISITDDLTPYQCGWDDEVIQHFINLKIDKLVEKDNLNEVVTATLAEANKRTVDMLTALAEGPETVISIKKGVMEVIRLYTDARKGHLRIINSAKRVQREHERKIARANYSSRQQWLAARNARTKRNIEHKRQQTVKQLRRDLALALKEFADAVSQIWLTFRYGIMPNVYLVEDLIKANKATMDAFVRFGQKRHFDIEPPEMSGFKSSGKIPVVLRAFNKRKFEDVALASKEYSFNVAVTLWELVPLSFVADWIVNIGEVLSMLFGGTKEYIEASTISVKLEDSNIVYSHDSGATVSVNFRGYSRKVINPLHYCALRFDPYIDLVRKLDAISLSYQIFTKDALKRLINSNSKKG